MIFNPNKTPIETIKEGAFDGTCINEKWYKNSWKEFDQLEIIDPKFYALDYYDVNVNKYGVKCGTSLRFWENKGWINKIDLYGWIQWYFRYRLGRSRSRFWGKLVKMIRDAGSKFDDYSISPEIRQILLHWGYEVTEKNFFNVLSN